MLIYRVQDNRVLQHQSPQKYLVPDGSQGAILIGFSFDESWGMYPSKFVQFSKFGVVYNIMLNNENCCYLPAQLDDGKWSVGVFGLIPNQPGKRMTSINSELIVVPNQFKKNGLAPKPPEDDYYALLFKQMQELATGVEENSETADAAAEICVKAREDVEAMADAVKGDIDKITQDVMASVTEKVYTKEETYSKVDISEEGEIALTTKDIDAILI